MPLTPKQMINLLEDNGYRFIRQNGSHRMFEDAEGKKVVVPVHSKDLKKGTEQQILKTAGIKLK